MVLWGGGGGGGGEMARVEVERKDMGGHRNQNN